MVLDCTVEPDILTDTVHDQLDHVVINHYTEIIQFYPGSQPQDPTTYAMLLATVVKHSNGTLDLKHGKPDTARELIENNKELVEHLQQAWQKKSFRDIRNMTGLRAAMLTEGSPISGDRSARLKASFTSEYLGTATLGFMEYLEECNRLFRASTPQMYYGRFCAIVQSSGTGKSRLMTEMSKVGGPVVLYMNLLDSELVNSDNSFPPQDLLPANVLVRGLPDKEKDYHNRCCAYFAAIFTQLEEELYNALHHTGTNKSQPEVKAAIQKWNKDMNDWSQTFSLRNTFFSNVHTKYDEICNISSNTSTLPASKSEGSGDGGITHREKRRRVSDNHAAKSSSTTSNDTNVESVLAKAHATMINNLPEIFSGSDSDTPKLIIAIDEAHSLNTLHKIPQHPSGDSHQGAYRPSHTVCRVVSMWSHLGMPGGGPSVWAVFASTTGKVADFSAPNHIHNSTRVYSEGQLLFPPYTALGWNIMAPELSSVAATNVASFGHIVKFGRPLWASDTTSRPAAVLRLASTKLLFSSEFNLMSSEQALAILGQRFALEVACRHPDAIEFLEKSVASHLQFCYETTADRVWNYTGYPCEPLLSCVAANHLHAGTENLAAALDSLQKRINAGMIEKGQRGELASRLLWLLSKDLYLRREGPIDSLKPEEWDANLADCDMVPVVPWFEYIFGEGFWAKDSSGNAREVFAEAYVNFSHWLSMDASIAGTQTDPGLPIDEWSLDLWKHTSAVQCCHHQPHIDKVIPLYFKNDTYGSSDQQRMSQIFISDKARKSDSKDDLPTICRSAVARNHHRNEAFNGPPYIAILVDLGIDPAGPTVTFDQAAVGEECKCLRIHVGGIDGSVYPFLTSHSKTMGILQNFARLPEVSEYKPTVRQLKAQARYGATATRTHMAQSEVPLPSECRIDRIIKERRAGRGYQYLVRWVGFGPEDDEWLSRRALEECEALDVWEKKRKAKV